MAYHIDNSDPGYTRSRQQLDKNLKINFVSLSKNTREEKEENTDNCKPLCVTRKRNNGNCKAFCIIT